MDLLGELGRVHEIEANQENDSHNMRTQTVVGVLCAMEETRETLLFFSCSYYEVSS